MAPPNGSKIFKTLACGEHLRFKGLHVSHTLREEVYGSEKIADYSDSLCILQRALVQVTCGGDFSNDGYN